MQKTEKKEDLHGEPQLSIIITGIYDSNSAQKIRDTGTKNQKRFQNLTVHGTV